MLRILPGDGVGGLGVGFIELGAPGGVAVEGYDVAVVHEAEGILDLLAGHFDTLAHELADEGAEVDGFVVEAEAEEPGVELLGAVQDELVVQEPGFCEGGAGGVAEECAEGAPAAFAIPRGDGVADDLVAGVG